MLSPPKAHLLENQQENDLCFLTEFFKALGDSTRIRILQFLMEREACVSDLATELGLTSSAVSHQLSILRGNKLVRRRRNGKMIYYSLDDEHVQIVMEKGMEHILQR